MRLNFLDSSLDKEKSAKEKQRKKKDAG